MKLYFETRYNVIVVISNDMGQIVSMNGKLSEEYAK